MRIRKLVVKIILFLAIFLGAEHLVHFCAFDDRKAISRVMLHELYHQKDGIDVLFCGASHVQLSFDPSVTDEIFQANTFNAGSSAQPLEATDAIIREAASLYDLKEVYVDLDYSIATRSEVSLESIYAVSDYMRPSWNKAEFLLHATPARYYLNSFLPLGQGRTLTHNPSEIPEIVKGKFSYNYRHFISDVDSYQGKGYIASHVYLEPEEEEAGSSSVERDSTAADSESGTTQEGSSLNRNGVLERQKAVFQKELEATPPSPIPDRIPEEDQVVLNDIISFCQEKEISLTFVVTPMSDYYLSQIGNYDDYIAMVRTFLAGKDVPFYDFNLARTEYLDLSDVKYYTDSNHLNRDGARLFSEVFGKFFTGQIPEADLFYSSYSEKLADLAGK